MSGKIRAEVVEALARAMARADQGGAAELAAVDFQFSPPPTDAERAKARAQASSRIREWLEDMKREGEKGPEGPR